MKIVLSGLFSLFLIMIALLNGGCKVGEKPMPPAIDPVCGIEVGVSKAREAGLISEWKDKSYYFCSSGCKSKFDEMPMMYHAKCPVCNATIQKTAALVTEHGGKVYFFDVPEHRASFIKEPMTYVGELVTDVVCSMDVVKAKAAEAGLSTEYGGKTYYFCGAGCKEKFLKAPDQFLGERAAVCPVCGMTVVKKNAEAEGLNSTYQGSPFYFCASSCKRYFDRNPGKYTKRKQ
jgi:YHS domain-containing protein